MKKITSLFALALMANFMGISIAQAGPYYVAINAGAAKYNDFCNSSAAGFSCNDISIAYGIDGGYQFSNMFGIELGYGSYGITKTSGVVLGSNMEIKEETSGAKLTGTATFPISESFAIIAKLGAAYNQASVNTTITPGPIVPPYTASRTSLAYGVGVKYSITPSFALRAQYENLGKIGDATIGTDTVSLLTMGLSYNFGKSRPRKIANKPVVQLAPAAVERSIRVIVFLEKPPAADRQKLTAAVAAVCKCQPVFVRMYSSKAVIYQIDLAAEQTFSSFKNELLLNDTSLGMTGLMQHQ